MNTLRSLFWKSKKDLMNSATRVHLMTVAFLQLIMGVELILLFLEGQ